MVVFCHLHDLLKNDYHTMKQFSSFNCMIRHKYGFLRDSKFESVVCMDLFPVFFNGMYCGIMVMADNGKRKDGIYGEYSELPIV